MSITPRPDLDSKSAGVRHCAGVTAPGFVPKCPENKINDNMITLYLMLLPFTSVSRLVVNTFQVNDVAGILKCSFSTRRQ